MAGVRMEPSVSVIRGRFELRELMGHRVGVGADLPQRHPLRKTDQELGLDPVQAEQGAGVR